MKDFLSCTPGNFIDGDWQCDSAEWMDAVNPATGERLARLPKSSRETAVAAIAAARAAQPAWAAATVWERAALCHHMADAVEAAQPHLSRILSLAQGRAAGHKSADCWLPVPPAVRLRGRALYRPSQPSAGSPRPQEPMLGGAGG